jgi:hypothetical protein
MRRTVEHVEIGQVEGGVGAHNSDFVEGLLLEIDARSVCA